MSFFEHEQMMWAILGEYGLYYGTWQTRAEAIGAHVEAKTACVRPVDSGKLTPDGKRAWAECRRKGDRAVKVAVTVIK